MTEKEIFLKYEKTDPYGGFRHTYIVTKNAKNNAYHWRGVDANVKFLPGEFVLDFKSGKLIPYETNNNQ